MSGTRSPRPAGSPRPAEGGIEALLARTRRQVAGFTLVAIVSVIAVVGVGSAIAGTRAIDAGLDDALRERATDILHEIEEKLPPLPSPEPSGDPSESDGPDESSAPRVTPSPGESTEPEPTLPPGNEEEEEEEEEGEDEESEGSE